MINIHIEITSISPRNGGEEFALTFKIANDCGGEEKETLIISLDQYIEYSPKKGVSSEEEYDSLLYASKVYYAVKKAVFLLQYGSCSKKALFMKLCSRGIEKDAARDAVEIISQKGLISPESDAVREAEKCFEKNWGKRKIAAKLFEKGFEEQDIRGALEDLDSKGANYTKSCALCIRKKYKTLPDNPIDVKKMYSYLLGRGFTSSEIKKAILKIQGSCQ